MIIIKEKIKIKIIKVKIKIKRVSPASRVGGGLLGIMIMASMGRTEWKGGFP